MSVFSEIVKGNLPCYKIYEDERTLAFLDIEPEAPGHVLVIPKVEVDRVYDLSEEDYNAVMQTVKKLSRHLEDTLGERTMIKIVGTDVPHAHVHLLPINENWAGERHSKPTPEEMEAMRAKLEYKG